MALSLLKKDNGSAAAATHALKRSSKWKSTRKAFLKLNPHCKACIDPKRTRRILQAAMSLIGLSPVEVHHIIPFHFCVLLGRPELELDPRNLITLCDRGANHHLLIGHLSDYQTFNPSVFTHVAKFKGWNAAMIKADPYYVRAIGSRPKTWIEMDVDERASLYNLVSRLYPK